MEIIIKDKKLFVDNDEFEPTDISMRMKSSPDELIDIIYKKS